MSRNLNQKNGGDKREAILSSAVKVFASKGYFNSKVADIAGKIKRIAGAHSRGDGQVRRRAGHVQVSHVRRIVDRDFAAENGEQR